MMSPKERFEAALLGEKADAPFLWESGIDDDALARWYGEGLPQDADPFGYLGLDRFAKINLGLHPIPALKVRKVDEGKGFVTQEDEAGGIYRISADGPVRNSTRINTTYTLRWPLHDGKSWEIIKSRLDPLDPARIADYDPFINGEDLVEDGRWSKISGFWGSFAESKGLPAMLMFTGPTYWFVINAGFENAAIMLFDEPELVRDIYGYLARFYADSLEYIFSKRIPDIVVFDEEICYKGGLFMSPEMYASYVCPCIDRIVGICRKAGVRFIFGESGGNISSVIPIWRDLGINGILPLDVSGGTDPVETRIKYRDLYLIGGIDRMALENGREEIKREIENTAAVFYREGRAIPSGDCHFAVSDKVSFDCMRYYVDSLRELWEKI